MNLMNSSSKISQKQPAKHYASPYIKAKNYKIFDFSYTPKELYPSKSQFMSPHSPKSNNKTFLRPTRHSSLNFEKREKYISHINSYLLKKIKRVNKNEDHNLQIISRILPCENDLYEKDDFPMEKSPTGNFSLWNSIISKNSPSPMILRFTRVESNFFKEPINIFNEENSLEEKNKEKILNESKNEMSLAEIDEKLSKGSALSKSQISEREKRILSFLEKEDVQWIPVPTQKNKVLQKNKETLLKASKKPEENASNLLNRRKFKKISINLSSSCDDLTSLVNAQSVGEEVNSKNN